MRATIRYFLSYAHTDSATVKKLTDFLAPLFKISARYEFVSWSDHEILTGEGWRAEIENAVEKADFGLLFLSPQFLASDFISRNELPALLAKRMVVPVGLQAFPLDGSIDLKGLQDRQIFRDSKGRAFGQCSKNGREEFARQLFSQIHRLMEKYAC